MANQWSESDDDFIRMQQEAIRRVREMQSRARATLENAGMHIENQSDMPATPPVQGYSTPDHESENVKHEETESTENNKHEPEIRQNVYTPESEQRGNVTEKQNQREVKNERIEHETEDARHENKNSKGSFAGSGGKRGDPLSTLTHIINNPMINLSLESDQIMLMILIYLLVQDGADKWLILSLAYVLII